MRHMSETNFSRILTELKERRQVLREERLSNEQKQHLYVELEKWHTQLGTTRRGHEVVMP